MFRWLIAIIFAFTMTGCCCKSSHKDHCRPYRSNFCPASRSAIRQIDYRGLVDVVFGWGTEIKNTEGTILKSSCSVFDKKIKTIRMEFVSQDIFELQEARKFLVYAVEGLLERVNNYATLAGSLNTRPFGPQNLEIIIVYESFHGYFVDPTYNGRTALINGEVVFNDFNVYNSDVDEFGCKHEPYFLTKQLVEIEDKYKTPYASDVNKPLGFNWFKELYVPPARR
ncbi:MAG: hypothetical protein WC222_07825 [Parachlamydiales bacterium]|jgi:hypothetical protein